MEKTAHLLMDVKQTTPFYFYFFYRQAMLMAGLYELQCRKLIFTFSNKILIKFFFGTIYIFCEICIEEHF